MNFLLDKHSEKCLNSILCEPGNENNVKNFLQNSEPYYLIETDHIREYSKIVHSILETMATQYKSDEYKFLNIDQANVVLEATSLPKLLVLIISQETNNEPSTVRNIINKVILHDKKIIIIHRTVDNLKDCILQLNDPLVDRLTALKSNLKQKSQDFLGKLHSEDILKEKITVFLQNSNHQFIICNSSEVTEKVLKIQEILTGLPDELKRTYGNKCMVLDWEDVGELEIELLPHALSDLVILVSFKEGPPGLEILKQLLLEHYKIRQKKIIFVTPSQTIKDYLSSNQTYFDQARANELQSVQQLNNISNDYLNTLPIETNQNFNMSQFLSNKNRNYDVVETPYAITAAIAIWKDIQNLRGMLKGQYSLNNCKFLYWKQVEYVKNNFGLTFKLPKLLVLICQTHPSNTAVNLLEALMFKVSFSNRKKLIFITEDERLTESLNRMHINIQGNIPLEVKEDLEDQHPPKMSKFDLNLPTLSKAAKNGNIEIVNLYIKNGAKINVGAQGSSMRPIEEAATNGHFYVVLLFLKHGADFDWDENTNPLHRAVTGGHVDIVTILLENDANVNAKDKNKETALHRAVTKGQLEMVKTLIGFFANIEAVDCHNQTPLHKAAEHNQIEIANFLLKLNANPDAKDNRDLTPLHIAIEKGHEVIVNNLIELGADVNCKTTEAGGYTKTPLHIAAKCGWDKIVELLLRFNANMHSETSNHETVLQLGRQSGNPNVETVLNRFKRDAEPVRPQ
ncbi:uncharacterized protein [Euwallacea fornicatus]|uniref:uncharacterized protein n=1 Tax=Euwallacea fornicatus TaxID=995702 RepID=UPI00338D81B7